MGAVGRRQAAHLGHWDFATGKSIGRANSPPIPRLGIKGYNYGTECNSGKIVGYPQNMNMAATFNRTVVWHAGASLRDAARTRAAHSRTERRAANACSPDLCAGTLA